MNYIWCGMILLSIIYAGFHGTMQPLSDEILNCSKEAIQLSIYMAGIVGIWSGIMKICEKNGLLDCLEKLLMPVIGFLYPDISDRKIKKYIAMNMAANLLGLGWAATPSGLKAIKGMKNLNKNSEIASKEMCTLLIINISSLQLIPVNIIAYRSQFGSSDPTAIIIPALCATSISTVTGILFCKVMQSMIR